MGETEPNVIRTKKNTTFNMTRAWDKEKIWQESNQWFYPLRYNWELMESKVIY